MESPLSPRDFSTAIDVHSDSDQSERSNAEQQAAKIRCKPIPLHQNAKNESSRIPAHLMDIELRYTFKMQTSTKKLIPTALKTFIPSWTNGPSFCKVYRPEDVTIVSIDLPKKDPCSTEAPEEEIDVCIRLSDVPYSYEWNTALNKELPLYKISIRQDQKIRHFSRMVI